MNMIQYRKEKVITHKLRRQTRFNIAVLVMIFISLLAVVFSYAQVQNYELGDYEKSYGNIIPDSIFSLPDTVVELHLKNLKKCR